MSHDFLEFSPVGEAISEALPKTAMVKEHFRTLPYQKCGEALKAIEATQAALASKMCLWLIILTACCHGEARNANCDEIDMDTATWTIPASRMKARRGHNIALSSEAFRVLQDAQEISNSSGLIFPSPMKQGKPISENPLTKVLKIGSLGIGYSLYSMTTAHGSRTSFRVRAEEQTGASHSHHDRRTCPAECIGTS